MKISEPTLLLDIQQCRQNIQKMIKKAKKHDLIFRPHFKTHQSIQIGEIFKEFDVNKITVSSVEMADYFANAGWNDITIAFPFNLLEINKIEELSDKINLNILVSSEESAKKIIDSTNISLNYFIEIDAGYHRSGILADEIAQIQRAIHLLSQHNFKGFLTHSGNTYQAQSTNEILFIHQQTTLIMKDLKSRFTTQFPKIIASVGDTPSCSLAENFENIDEIRPGNFVFFDLMQYHLEVCDLADIAVCVACPVVDINRHRKQIVIYGGGIHFSKEFIMQNGMKNYGQVVKLNDLDWQESAGSSYLIALSQEHGIIQASDELISEISIGDIIGIIPVHSCMTANLMGSYKTLDNQIFDHK